MKLTDAERCWVRDVRAGHAVVVYGPSPNAAVCEHENMSRGAVHCRGIGTKEAGYCPDCGHHYTKTTPYLGIEQGATCGAYQ